MVVRYQFFESVRLLIIQYIGIFSIDRYKKSTAILQNIDSNKNLKLLFDLRHLKTGKDFLVIKELIKVRETAQFKNHKVAYVVEDPKILVNIHLYKDHINSSDYQYFSTLKPAIHHLGMAFTEAEIEERINDLEHTLQ